MKYIHILLLCLTLSSCSALGVATGVAKSMLGEQPTLSVKAQVGDRETNVGQTTNHEISADKNEGIITVASDSSKDSKRFEKADTVNIHEGPDWGIIFLLILGWVLPTPLTMCREAVQLITKWTKQTPVRFV